MKTTCLLLAVAGADAFAPVNQPARVESRLNGDLTGLRGVGPETGGKVVSSLQGTSSSLALQSGCMV